MQPPELERLAQQTKLRTAALQLPGSPAPHPLTDLYVEPVLASASGEKLSPEAALARTPALVIVGPPGSGKTTLLQRLAWTQAVDFLAGMDKRCPVFLQARSAVNLIRTLDLPTLIAESFTGNYNPRLESGLLASWIVDDRVSLFIDGLDEIGRAEDRDNLFRAIQAARDTLPHLHLIVSSRPIAISGWLSSFSFFELQSFADSAVLDYIRRFTREAPDLAERFTETLNQNDQLRELAKSPLLLTLLWQIFQAKGQLPTSRSFIYADITDFLLSRWDQVRGVAREAEPSPRQLQLILQRCALYLIEQHAYQITKEEVLGLISNVHSWSLERINASRVLTAIVDSGLFREFGSDAYGFVHLSFLEYFAARALVEEEKLVSILDRPDSREIILVASGMLIDVGPLVEAIVARGDLLLAATCLSNGRRKNPQLTSYVIQEIRKQVGEPFVRLLAGAYSASPEHTPRTEEQAAPKAAPSKTEPPDIYTVSFRQSCVISTNPNW